ncbi:MAG: type II toxin-antitoxin system VapC family toxin [Acidobacteriota bacterium]
MTRIYLDTAYVAKVYLNETDSLQVRKLIQSAAASYTSALTVAELACTFHRHRRESTLDQRTERLVRDKFLEDVDAERWLMVPVSDRILRRVELLARTMPSDTLLRAGDAIQLVSAMDAGFHEIWSNDRRLLAAAKHFGLTGRSVSEQSRKFLIPAK